ncbi:F0F1 ATP synthase subunit gamma [Sulfuricella sp. T08]|uniref:F0F1 ATP synthase subunit gamma n=1 Tax=Sulfuricella sp. T08 TaxID=1632857 RepID=UPI00061795C2|nr:F0F1 ATP synthase subunit gamma [Sulfuricella sp. T08]MBU1690943.1 F0F1 ATP synthase subunit gamma [Gammaproteobacteria bacterium]MBU1977912.1 F0F1 ATP synthase subunit gamma [Gammaproteobacteria bacterium]GAO34925.1 F0F1 ATP synthase subunit gamma [Sulfuricella sp. T08]
MAGGKEIRTKIKSVQNTQKITRAMEMVAASKMRKAQDRMRAARPYAEKIRNVAAHLSHANPEYKHPFLVKRENPSRIGVIVVTSDKGLCGGLNTNVLRMTLARMKEWEGGKHGVEVCAIGNKALGFMQRIGASVLSQATHLGDTPHMEKLIGPVKLMLDAYNDGRIDALHICFTRFVNTMKQEPVMEQLLPISGEALGSASGHWDYIYEPDAKQVIDELLVRYIETLIYQSVAENIASEQSSRMVAMKAASDNAGNVIDELKLIYNKTRQAAITKELSEIVAGAAAV